MNNIKQNILFYVQHNKITYILVLMVIIYMALMKPYKLIRRNEYNNSTTFRKYRKYRNIETNFYTKLVSSLLTDSNNSSSLHISSSSDNSTNTSKSLHLCKKKINKILRKFKITE